MLAAAVILALAISARAAPADPQIAGSAPRDAAPRDPTQNVKGSGVIRGRITSLDTGKPLRRAQVSLTADELVPPPRTASTSNEPGGDYFLVALDYVHEGQWNDPEFLDGLKARAERVAIADAESKQMDLVVRK